MEDVRRSTIELVFKNINSGFVFEKLAQELMCAIQGENFIPVGGVHDGGIDGLEFVYEVNSSQPVKKIYQFSIQQNAEEKIRKTIDTLISKDVRVDRLVYGTNVVVQKQNTLMEKFYETKGVNVQICDINWFGSQINHVPKAVQVFNRYVEDNLHTINRPSAGFELINVEDPRIYIYLRHNLDNSKDSTRLDELLIDTLILLGLEGTDSSKGTYRSKKELLTDIENISNFDKEWLDENVTRRLSILSRKPRRVKHRRDIDKYCLPYETRLELIESQQNDRKLYEDFKAQSMCILKSELRDEGVTVRDSLALLEKTFHDIFFEQGLEFSHFVESGDGANSTDIALTEIVSSVVDGSKVIQKNREKTKQALLKSVREVVYNGTSAQVEFLAKLCSTYRMLFLLQCDPQLAQYFEVMAGRLSIYVDTSILIPAMSEYFLDEKNKRYTNLLICARDVGIKLNVTPTVMSELAAHFRHIKSIYLANYENQEEIYLDEDKILYVPEILMRAYFYARLHDKVDSFRSFHGKFVSWQNSDMVGELILWTKEAFGIRYEEVSNLGLEIDPDEEDELFEILKQYKREQQARNDAKQLLQLYAIRERNNELGDGGVFGYSTWWLTSDTQTQRAFSNIGESSTRKNPYIRADFLYNYIAIAPSKRRVSAIYRKVFPTLIGVNISFHIPQEICEAIQQTLREHKDIVNTPRFKGALRSLTEQLKTDPNQTDNRKVVSWFVERANDLNDEVCAIQSRS